MNATVNIPPFPPPLPRPTWHFHFSYNLVYLVILAIIGIAVYKWLAEHDLRIRAEDQEKASEAIIKQNDDEKKQLKDQITQIQQDSDKKVAALQKQKASIKTPEQAAAALPQLVNLPDVPANFRPIPGGGLQVGPEAVVAVTQQLEEGKICAVKLDSCMQILDKEQKLNANLESDKVELTKEKVAWQKASGHKSFMQKVWAGTKVVLIAGISGAIGYGIHH